MDAPGAAGPDDGLQLGLEVKQSLWLLRPDRAKVQGSDIVNDISVLLNNAHNSVDVSINGTKKTFPF